jgi:D-alanyl-D-alanine dipeptidase
MTAAGFHNLTEEWWHYTLENEPFPDISFDFPVSR